MIEILDGLANNHAKLEKLDEDDFGDHSLASLSSKKIKDYSFIFEVIY